MSSLTKKDIVKKLKQNGKKKTANPFSWFYRVLRWTGLKLQFVTYNKRRRIRKFFSPVSGRISAFFSSYVAKPVSGAWNEFLAISARKNAFRGLLNIHCTKKPSKIQHKLIAPVHIPFYPAEINPIGKSFKISAALVSDVFHKHFDKGF